MSRFASRCLGLAAVVLDAMVAPTALAQSWPDRPITLINPASAGGSNELIKTSCSIASRTRSASRS